MRRLFFLFTLWAISLFVFVTCVHQRDVPQRDVVIENTKKGPGPNISVDPVAASNLEEIYASTEKEIPFCLFGSENPDGSYRVNRLGVPQINSSETGTTTFNLDRCSKRENFLGMVHNHERGSCYPSQTDIRTFYSSGIDIFMVYCKKQGDPIHIGVTRDIFDEDYSPQ